MRHDWRPPTHLFWVYFAVLAATAAISQAEGSWVSLIVIAVALVFGERRRRGGRTFPMYMRTPLGVIAAGLFTVDYLYYSRGVLITIAHLVVMTSAIYLVTSRTLVDWLWLLVQGVVLLSAAGAATFEVPFLLYAIAFMTAAVFFARSALMWQASQGPWRLTVTWSAPLRRRSLTFAASAVAVMFLSGALIYALFPRMKPLGLTEPFIMPGTPVTGFSSEVSLGSGVGNILQNDTLAFRAKVSIEGSIGESTVPLYWRGTALVKWTGDGWRRQPPGMESDSDYIMMPLPLRIQARGRAMRALGRVAVEQDITLERLSTDALFALPGVRRFDSPVTSAVRFDIRTGEVAKAGGAVTGPYIYTVTSYPAFPTGDLAAARGFGYLGPDRHMQMAVETDAIPPRVVELAQRIAGTLPTAYDRAVAIKDYLQSSCEYSTEMVPPAAGQTALESFLFDTRRGHCEYFATALALMLRAVDVPTRVVNGFLGGEYNHVGDYYSVLQSNAHSWTEVYFNGRGWYTFDATPEGVGGTERAGRGWLRSVVDFLRYKWLGSVAGYNSETQQTLYNVLGLTLRPVAKPIGKGYDFIRHAVHHGRPGRRAAVMDFAAAALVSVLVLAAALLAVAAAGWLSRLARAARGRVAARRYPHYYAIFLHALKRRGFVRRGDETPLELALRAAHAGAVARDAAETIVQAYYRERFAARPLEPDEAAEVLVLARGAARVLP